MLTDDYQSLFIRSMNDYKFPKFPPSTSKSGKFDKLYIKQKIAGRELLDKISNSSSHIEFFDDYCKKIRLIAAKR